MAGGALTIDFRNIGEATAVFQARSANPLHVPRSYTVEPHKHLSDVWPLAPIGASDYDLSVHGPNGFFRQFTGGIGDDRDGVTLEIRNRTTHITRADVLDAYSSKHTTTVLGPGEADREHWRLRDTKGWYDLLVTVSGDEGFSCRVAGHLENGDDSISDPAMGNR